MRRSNASSSVRTQRALLRRSNASSESLVEEE
jgi:hypothetical protein